MIPTTVFGFFISISKIVSLETAQYIIPTGCSKQSINIIPNVSDHNGLPELPWWAVASSRPMVSFLSRSISGVSTLIPMSTPDDLSTMATEINMNNRIHILAVQIHPLSLPSCRRPQAQQTKYVFNVLVKFKREDEVAPIGQKAFFSRYTKTTEKKNSLQ